MTELLFERGLERIGFIGSIYATSSIMDRYCGFMKSMLEHKKKVPEEWLIEDRDDAGQVGFDLPNCLPEAFVCNCDLVAGMTVSMLTKKTLFSAFKPITNDIGTSTVRTAWFFRRYIR